MPRNSQKPKNYYRLKIFDNENPELNGEYQDLVYRRHYIGSKYLPRLAENSNQAVDKSSDISKSAKPIKSNAPKNISSAFTGIWANPNKIDIYELLLWREKMIVNCLINSKESPLYSHIVNLRQQAINVIENKYKDIIIEYLQTLCTNSNKRRKIFCGNDLLMSFSKFAHKRGLKESAEASPCNNKQQILKKDPKKQNTSVVKKLTRVYFLNKMILGVSVTTNSCIYKNREF